VPVAAPQAATAQNYRRCIDLKLLREFIDKALSALGKMAMDCRTDPDCRGSDKDTALTAAVDGLVKMKASVESEMRRLHC